MKFKYILFMIILMIPLSYANECVQFTETEILEEACIYGSDVDSRGWIKWTWNLTGLGIDYSDITGSVDLNVNTNDIPEGQGIRIGMTRNQAVDLDGGVVATILGYSIIGNTTDTSIGGSGTGVMTFNITNALREVLDTDTIFTFMMNNPAIDGEPNTYVDATGFTQFYIGKRLPEDAKVDSTGGGFPPIMDLCYRIGEVEITNSSWNGTSPNILEGSGKAWNSGFSVNVSSDLLSFVVNASVNSNMSCSLDNDVNFTTMVNLDSNFKSATTDTTVHAYTLSDDLSLGSNNMYCSFINSDGSGELADSTSGALNIFMLDLVQPNVTQISQTPADIDGTNAMLGINHSWTITDNFQIDNVSMISSINVSNYFLCENGSCIDNPQIDFYETLDNLSSTYNFILDDNQVYGGLYPLTHKTIEDSAHTSNALTGNNDFVKMEINNISNKEINYLEIMANTTSALSTQLWFCNSSYTTGSITASANCVNFENIEAIDYNHSHNDISKHQVIPFNINADGDISGVHASETGYFLMRGRGGWAYYSVAFDNSNTQTTSNSGGAWANQAVTVDMHLHQFNNSDFLQYSVCANDTTGNLNCSTIIDSFGFDALPPNSPDVYNPTGGIVTGLIDINWTASVPSIAGVIVYYDLVIIDSSDVTQANIGNQSTNLTERFNVSGLTDGSYRAKVTAFDNNSLSAFGISESFLVDNNDPTIFDVSINSSSVNQTVLTFATLNDSTELNAYRIGDNSSGTWNVSGLFNISGNMIYIANFTIDSTGDVGESIGYYYNVIDMTGGSAEINTSFLTTLPPVPPTPPITVLRFNTCPEDIPAVLLLIFIFTIAFVMIMGMLVFRSLGLGLLGGLIWLTGSFIIIGCNNIIGIILIVSSILFLFVMLATFLRKS